MKAVPNAFTLIELLIVITVMAFVGIIVLPNYKSFGEDQGLKNAVLDVQSKLRQAQTSATTNLKCNDQSGALWQVEFTNPTTVKLKCQPEPSASPLPSPSTKTSELTANIIIESISGVSVECPTAPPFADPLPTISFAPLSGKIDLGGGPNCDSLTITLKNTKTNTSKDLKIEQGGQIYEP